MCFWALFFIFATCEIGERMYQNSYDVEDKIEQLDWYKYPYEVQRMIPVFIMNAQKGIAIEFFGTISCSRAQFTKASPFEKK